ncbi:MAG: DUF2336 domain-containing protein [Caulobacteraceae bacterium]
MTDAAGLDRIEEMVSLVRASAPDEREALLARLAGADWVPAPLIHRLAREDIEVARPLIAESAAMDDAALLLLLTQASLEHRIAVARRPGLGAAVSAAIVAQGEPVVLTALAGNQSAELPEALMAELTAASRQIASLRGPLARHPRLSADEAGRLQGWVGEALRADLVQRFGLAPTAPDAEAGPDPDQREMETRLVAKLQAAGQLRPGYLLRALREGKLSLFATALACLAGFETDQVEAASRDDDPRLLALACAAVGIDRSAFPTLIELVRRLSGREPAPSSTAASVQAAFALSPEAAAEAFRAAIDAV